MRLHEFLKRRARLLVGIVVSLICFYFALRIVDLAKVWETYRGANYWYLLPALGMLIVISWARARRWRLLMYPNDQVPLERLFSIVNIGYLFNNILPAKAGELVRAYLAGRVLPGGVPQTLSTLLVERLLDVLMVVVLLVALFPFVTLPLWIMRAGLLFGGIAVGGAVFLVLLARLGDRGLEKLWGFLARLPLVGHPRVKEALRNVLKGLRVLSVGKFLPRIILWSLSIWLGYGIFNYLIMAAFRMTYLPLLSAFVVLCATGFSMMVPSSPGAFGPFEAAVVLALSLYGVAESAAFGYGFGLHAFTNISLIVLGLWGLRQESVSFSAVREKALEQKET
ncbi:MAG: lysylphosphatidylglycerol synthase transmembrane domain-containing protein [Chloroflexota bacterium]|nr:lysylphosphatidylglycerol synthase transmembrane domain-containing protein [Chloroflexota bacterium]